MIKADGNVKIDQSHLDLIYGLLTASKPKKVLELGMGSGIATDVILKAFAYNEIPLNLTCVDNWHDWHFIKPPEIARYESNGVKVITSPEKDFVFSCHEKYDFIVSDADHDHAQDWFEKTLSLLRDHGILIYHDVTNPDFANLYTIYQKVQNQQLPHMLFNVSSKPNEKCERGLLVIYGSQHYVRPLSITLWYHVKRLAKAILRPGASGRPEPR